MVVFGFFVAKFVVVAPPAASTPLRSAISVHQWLKLIVLSALSVTSADNCFYSFAFILAALSSSVSIRGLITAHRSLCLLYFACICRKLIFISLHPPRSAPPSASIRVHPRFRLIPVHPWFTLIVLSGLSV